MATEADVLESISVTTEAGDGYVSTGKFDITVDECSPLQLKKSEGQEDEHPEPVKCFVEGETARDESKNGISECRNPLEPLSDPKVGKQETCVAESFQVDESNQAETWIPDRENGEKGSEEKEAVEATEKKAEQHVESNGIVNAEAAEASRSETNIDEHIQVISDQQDSVDEIRLEKSFTMVYEEKGPQVTLETKESAEDKLESASMLDDHEEKAGLGKEIQEKNIPDTPLLTQTEDIIEKSPKEVKNQYETVEETPEASGTASEAVKEDENAECQVEIPCMKREEDTLKKGETLDIGEASVVKEEDTGGISAVEPSKRNSTDHEGESETNFKDFLLARPNLNSEEDEAATSRESSKIITTAEDERQVVNLEQNREEEVKAEKANTSSDIIEDETPDKQNLPVASILMQIVTESEIAEVGESTISEPNENVERSKEVLNVSTVKCDERDQGDGTNPTEDDKEVDTFTAKVTEDDDYTSPVMIAETSAKVTPNDEESSPQTLQKCDSGEELQHLRDVMPEETKTETSRENAEEITCTKEETTTQNTQESLDEEKKEATENTNNLEDDNARDEVLQTAGTEQETGEHLVRESHTVAEPPQDFVDKETSEETSTEYQACTGAADLSINTEEKNLQEQAIPELSSPLVVEETAKEIPKNEETDVLILKEEKKEEDAECNERAEVKSMTREALPETTEDITEANMDLNAPISEESNNTFVENISSLAEVSETETQKNIQEDGRAVSNSDSVSGEVSHVTGLKEAETENEEQKDNIDTAPEEKAQATILKDETASEVEDIGVQAEENCESKEKLKEYIPTAADEAEKEEQIKYSDIAAEEKEANILTDETPLEDTDVQAEKNVEPIENLEEQIPIRADEGETILKEAEAESKEEIKNTDGSQEDVDGQGEEVVNSEENLDKQIPTGDCETSLKEAEAEKEEQGKSTDIVPEEKGPETILTDETSLDVEDIEVTAKDSVESKENVEEQIPIAADEEKTTYISLEDIDVQAEENFITRENLEYPILTTSDEQETGSEETEAEMKAQVKSIDIVPEEKGLETISTAETPLFVEHIGVKSEESFKSKENVEEQIPTAADEGEKFLKEAEADNKEQIDEENLNPQESSDKEKEEVTEITNTIEDDTVKEKVLETTSTEQETGEHVVHEIHTVAEPPQDSIDKETKEENSAEHQACTEAADLSTTAEEKNLEDHACQELYSPPVVEEADNEIPKEEETYTTLTTLLEEEEKEGHATCNEAADEYAAEIEKNIQEKDGATLSNSESVSGELSHVTILKESETTIEMQDKDIDTIPEERGQATILANETASEVEDIDVQLKENFESKENLEEQFPIAADEGEIFLKEAEAENKEQIKNADIAHEDVDVQVEKTINSEEDIDKQIPPIADEGETSLKEAVAENKEQVAYADIVPEEKGRAIILTDETPLEAEDTGVQAEESFESKEKFEEKNPIATDEDETFLKEAEAENKEQIKYSDIAPEDKGLATILTDEKASNIEDIGLQAEETFNSSKNLESKIPSTADEYETSLKEAKAVNMEQVKYTDIVPEERGLANIVTGETSLDVEDTDVKADENFESKENMEERFPTAPQESGTFLNEAEAENKVHIKNTDISPEEKGIATISTNEATLDVEDIGVQAERSFESKDDFEEKIPTAADEDETFMKKAEAETKEKIKCSEIDPEEKGLANLRDETSLDVKDIDVKADESFGSNENLEEQIPTAAGEGETRLREAEAETDVQVKNNTAPEEKVLPTISKDETALNIDDAYVQAEANSGTKEFSDEQIPTAADEGEGKIAHGNVVLNDTPGVQILEEAEPKVGVEEESCKSEDQPEKTNTIVEEVFNEPKITGREINKEEIVEGNVACFTQESIEEDTVNKSQENENEKKKLKEEGSCIESLKEGNGDGLSPEYIQEDESEMFKDDEKDAVKSGGEILKEPQTEGVDESITFETKTIAERSEEIVSTSPVKYEEGEQGESSSSASKEEGSNEDTVSIKVAEEGNGDNGAVTVTETSANVNGEEGLPQAVQKYEPVEGHDKLLDEMPEESKTESSSEKAEVVTCTKEEETTPMNDTKENETEVEEVFEIASTEQETGEHATQEIHTVEDSAQEFNDKETTVENLNEYQVSSEAADSSTDIVGKNSDEQVSRELSSSLVGDDTSNESTKQEENYVSSLKEEENEVNVECKEPKEGLYAHISEEETHTEESSKVVNSLQSEVSEKDGCTDLEGAEAETKEQVKDIEIDHEEKGLTTILTDGAALENVTLEQFPENQIPTAADEGECNTELVGDKAAEESLQVRRHEEAEPKLRVEDESCESEDHPENKNMIVEDPQLLKQVLDEPNSAGRDFSEGQTTEGNAAICAPEIIQEETAKNSQDSDKETENLQKEGSGIESIKAYNTTDLSREFTPEDGSKKFDDNKQDTVDNKQDTVKFEGEILKEPEIDAVGESTTYKTNQIVETSEEILDASPMKYEEGQPGEGSSQDSAKASKEEDVSEVDDSNGAVTVTESSAVVTSKGEEDSAEASEKYEPEEEKVPVKISDVADAKEVCDLEDKASFAEKTTEETSLQKEGHAEVSELAQEKLDVDATEEEFKEGSEIVPESHSRSIDVISKDEIVTSQTLDKGILQEQVEIPSCTLLTEEKEIEASQYDHETPTKDKNIEEEPEKEVPADGNVGDLFAVRSEDKPPLQKEESEELNASELALEKMDAGDTEKEFKETFKTISIPDSQSTDAVLKDEIVADQTHLEASYALLPKEEELRTYQDDRETTTQDKSIEEEYAKEAEVPADENGTDLVAATLAEETLLQKEEPRELKVSELAPKILDAGETEEIKEPFEKVSKSDSQSAEVVSGDETTAYQTLNGGISNEELQLPSSTLLAEENEMKISQCVHETTTQDKNKEDESTEKNEVPDGNTRGIFVAATSEEETRLQMEEPREFKACELAPEKLDAGETEEEIKETLETIPKSDSQSIDTDSKDDIVADQTFVGASYTSLPEEKEHQAGESEVPAAENGGDVISARSVKETTLKKEEPGELKVSELAPEELNAGETEEEIKKTHETVSEPDSPSTDVVSRDEAISDQTLPEGISIEKLQIPSSILLPEEKEIKASEEHRTTFCDKNIEENASNLQMQVDENVKPTSMEEETSLIKEEPRQLKASDIELQLKAEVPRKSSNEEIKEDEKLPEELEPYSVREESHDENKAKGEKQGEQIDETSSSKTNEHQNELSEVDEKGIASDKYERQLTFEGLSINENDPRFIEDKTTHDGFPEEEKRVEEAAFEFGLKIQGDEINSKSSITSTQMEKDSSTEVSCKAPIVETSQGIESNECGKVISTESGTVSLPNLVPESTKETATACKELKTEEDEEEEHENSEQVKTDEEKGENEHKNREAGYESPIMVEASRDADANVKVVSHKKSNNILSGIKHSMSKVKKAIIGKSSHPKTHSEK